MSVRVGTGVDVHAFSDEPGRPLVLAGVTIPGATGLAGHSDADVVVHAVADALLGAAALGDLGTLFGVDDPRLEGASSVRLLRGVIARLEEDGWQVGNLDVTVVAERPRLAEHRAAMRQGLADAAQVALSAVSVKITSTDALGALGRGEGIGAHAACTVVARSQQRDRSGP